MLLHINSSWDNYEHYEECGLFASKKIVVLALVLGPSPRLPQWGACHWNAVKWEFNWIL